MFYNIFLIIYLVGVIVGLWFVFGRAGEKPWKAVVPVYNIVVWIKICGKKWPWYLYFLVPALNVFTFLLMVVETARVFRRYNFWEQTFAVIFPWAYLPWLGLKCQSPYIDPRKEAPRKEKGLRDWADAIIFALVAAMIIRGLFVELYNIPSSSMEKSLMVGDHVLVSKMDYGAKTTQTPLAVPLIHNVLPGTNGTVESYLKWIQLPYHRYPGLGKVERFDAVVFHYPDGDTMCTALFSNRSYHDMVREYGREAVLQNRVFDSETGERIDVGKIRVRPVDKRENFIKRCIGLPGEDVQIVDQQVLINGQPIENPSEAQFTYAVLFNPIAIPERVLDQAGVSHEDIERAHEQMYFNNTPYYIIPMSPAKARKLAAKYEVMDVQPFIHPGDSTSDELFPNVKGYNWSIDNYGPVHIPARGETLQLNDSTLPFYRRLIEVFEGNSLEVKDGRIFINGQETTEYTVKMNYYWMMGDNRHNSIDSRYWGFVPEDHVVGRARFVYFSWDKDHGKVRWNRMFHNASAK